MFEIINFSKHKSLTFCSLFKNLIIKDKDIWFNFSVFEKKVYITFTMSREMFLFIYFFMCF